MVIGGRLRSAFPGALLHGCKGVQKLTSMDVILKVLYYITTDIHSLLTVRVTPCPTLQCMPYIAVRSLQYCATGRILVTLRAFQKTRNTTASREISPATCMSVWTCKSAYTGGGKSALHLAEIILGLDLVGKQCWSGELMLADRTQTARTLSMPPLQAACLQALLRHAQSRAASDCLALDGGKTYGYI